MPTHNQYYYENQQLSPNGLAGAGPLLQVEVSVPIALAEYQSAQGELVPEPVVGWALIDTGATKTAIDEDVTRRLVITAIDRITLGSASGVMEAGVYPCTLRFASGAIPDVEVTRATGVNLEGQSAAGQRIVALLGRDILTNAVFIYNGSGGHY